MSFDLSQLAVPEGLQFRPTMTTCTIEGSLEEEDLRELILSAGNIQPDEDDPSDLKKIREKHHHVARLIADGLSQRLVSSITGYSEGYISILLKAPAIEELVEFYRIKNGKAIEVATEKLKTVGLKALERLDTRIDADELDNNELISTAKLGLDRGGLGPSSTSRVIGEQHIFDHAKLTELNRNARARNAEYIVPQNDVREALQLPNLTTGAEHEANETLEAGTDNEDGSLGAGDSESGEQEARAGIPPEDLQEPDAGAEPRSDAEVADRAVVSLRDGAGDA